MGRGGQARVFRASLSSVERVNRARSDAARRGGMLQIAEGAAQLPRTNCGGLQQGRIQLKVFRVATRKPAGRTIASPKKKIRRLYPGGEQERRHLRICCRCNAQLERNGGQQDR